MKGIQTRKKNVKLPLFADDMLLYIGNPENFTKNVKHNKFSKVQDMKSIYKNQLYFYTITANYPKIS